MSLKTIALAAKDAVAIINTQLPLLKAFIPAVAAVGGPVTLGLSAAAALIPLLEQIPTGDEFTVEQQAALMDEVNGILSGAAFAGEAWHPIYFTAPDAPEVAATETPATETPAPKSVPSVEPDAPPEN